MKKQFIIIGMAALLAVLGIAALIAYANDADDRAFEGTEMVDVVRATTEVPARTTAADLVGKTETVKVPRAALVPGALSSLDDAQGLVTSVALVPGDQLSTAKLSEPDDVKAGTTVPKGMQELTIPVDGARLVGGAVKSGDRVGVIANFSGQTANPINGLLVLKVDSGAVGSDGAAGTLITVAVNTLDAEKLVNTIEFGTIWLTLQNDDTETGGGKTITSKDVAP
ncbi:Flp pilus assembly protein CpaB [Aeromicrobium fastidiosum]|uniref:Flp pilus assembly protein RcpC/CpaB domain-containing protein n=1 Tax=Aeromicrobium fastidiosum TaxID=52699 RepID=A0A641ANK8_9ACTN|nr:RcpC/CpaB family pilus assembly protein [Aeromicrobium fastidiosum]KAA1379670.1 hypothetical protein ESP62_000110 [Aeromicrobium fastidiosum]MBP2389145.1 pilus assembly protein CpaB [Aeromicrobium fastidiosum]